MWGLFGLDADQQAQREVTDLTDGRKEFKDWNLGDRFRSALTGVSKEDVLKRAQDIAAKNINTSANNVKLIGDTRRALAGTGMESSQPLRIQLGETEAQFQDRLSDDLERGTAGRQYLAQEGSDRGKISADTQTSDLIEFSTGAKAKVKADAVAAAEKRELTAHGRNIDVLAAQQAQSDSRYAHERAIARGDRLHQQKLSQNSNDLTMNLKLMDLDLADKRMAYDRKVRKADRRDRMIAQLMQGLGSLGSSF